MTTKTKTTAPAAEKTPSWDHWTTPESVLELVRRIGPIGFDPCTNGASTVRARLSAEVSGLDQDWFRHCVPGDVVYCNPPFSALEAWRHKAATTPRPTWAPWHLVLCTPDNGDTQSYRHLESAAVVAKLGRVKFGNPPPGKGNDRPRFGTCLAYYGTDASAFMAAFAGVASFWRNVPAGAAC